MSAGALAICANRLVKLAPDLPINRRYNIITFQDIVSQISLPKTKNKQKSSS
jgi:hypothetical protein